MGCYLEVSGISKGGLGSLKGVNAKGASSERVYQSEKATVCDRSTLDANPAFLAVEYSLAVKRGQDGHG